MPSYKDKMTRLHIWLKRSDHRFWGLFDGIGQTAIADATYTTIPDSEFWIVDFLSGRLKAQHIHAAIIENRSPYEIAEAAARRAAARKPKKVERNRSKNKRKSVSDERRGPRKSDE